MALTAPIPLALVVSNSCLAARLMRTWLALGGSPHTTGRKDLLQFFSPVDDDAQLAAVGAAPHTHIGHGYAQFGFTH